jgi:threonine/homoserine/homoserine lactone efflux protein
MPLANGRGWSAIGVLGLGAGILVVIILETAFLSEQASYSAVLRVRLASLGGGFLLVFLAVRTVTNYLHWNSMPLLEAGLVAQEAAWREGAVELGAINRWLTWMRVGTRRGAERKWRILSRRGAGT